LAEPFLTIFMINQKSYCPMCQGQKVKLREAITFDQMRAIWRGSAVDVRQYLPAEDFFLMECVFCSLQFFTPTTQEKKDFYLAFVAAHQDYYRISWDHQEILKHFFDPAYRTGRLEIKSVLDYGCGEGAFLKLLPKETSRIGIDFNCREVKDNNLKIIKTDLLSFKTEEKFEAVVSVQVLEHVSSTREHIEKMISLVRPGGYLFLSVPDQEGILSLIENQGKNLDFPPHHLTRWTKASLLKIAEIFSLRAIRITKEPLSFTHFKWAMNSFIGTHYNQGLVQKILRKVLLLSQEAKLPLFYPRFKKRISGHSILAVFQK
jgi:2-polyprenyl-3-methyl-5-hydroxy-6-metoxy-1,4-benzoquinol methylase